ncbi:MAG: Ribosomal RNA small subunit methyltransferase G [Betaproteobacteria bacterium ADurb.Bin341]|nr:MAG: Ribosomal RNA small subunit methyltransferase G [Betaproteobacteria bacterium ADurb.Bin341]
MNRQRLTEGLAALGLPPDAKAEEQLLAYLDLLLKWNKTYNLTAVRDPEQGLSHHLLDSLAILPWVDERNLLDVGSGGGLPGIPLAIVRPKLSITLVDAVQKKAGFLQQAAIELGLSNVRVVHGRVEKLQGQFGQIVSRAFADLQDFVGLTRHLLALGGHWLAMKGAMPEDEMARLPAGVVVERRLPLVVPGLDAKRHLLILKAGS